MLGQKKLERRLVRRLETICICQGIVAMIIRPAIPSAGFHLPKQIAGSPDRPAAAIVKLIFCDKQFSILRKSQSKWVSKPPCNKLDCRISRRLRRSRCRAGKAHAKNSTTARDVAMDNLSGGAGCAIGE